MSSKSRNRDLVIGRVAGHRGTRGEVTARIRSGRAERWTGQDHLVLADSETERTGERYAVEAARSYGDRLVLKLAGVENADAAAALKGRFVVVEADSVPALPDGEVYQDRLIGMRVVESGRTIGRVVDVMETAGSDLLVVEGPEDGRGEVLIPFVAPIVRDVDEERGAVSVCLPAGLLELSRDGAGGGR